MADLAHNVYSNDPGVGPFVIFPTHAHQILSNCIHIIGVSILSYCFARRTETERLGSWQWWMNLTWAKLLVVLVFFDSWIFLAFSGILVNGVGLSMSVPVCSLGIYACIVFYAGSKALIYLFLVERVWIVWSAGNTLTRIQSRIYKFFAVLVLGYGGIFIVMLMGRIAQLRDDGVCVIGLRSFATIPLLAYDLFVNVFLTGMFIWAIYREVKISQRLRQLARRTSFAAFVALTTSSINIVILAVLDGKQLGWVCLGACATDVTINALVLFWVTAGAYRESNHKALTLPSLNVPLSLVRDPGQTTHSHLGGAGVSLKEQEEGSARESPLQQLCTSPYPHRHHLTIDCDGYRGASPITPASPGSALFFGAPPPQQHHHHRPYDLEQGLGSGPAAAAAAEEAEAAESDIADLSSTGHNTTKEDYDYASVWHVPALLTSPSAPPIPLSANPLLEPEPEPESPAQSLATDGGIHSSRTRLAPATHALPPLPVLHVQIPHSHTHLLLPPPPPAGKKPIPTPAAAAAPPKAPARPTSRRLQRPRPSQYASADAAPRPRSVSSPPSTAMSRETGESAAATLVCATTCTASAAAYEAWRRGEGSSTGLTRFSAQGQYPGAPADGRGRRQRRRQRRIWRSFSAVGAALGLSRARSWALRGGPGGADPEGRAGECGVEVTVTKVDVVDAHRNWGHARRGSERAAGARSRGRERERKRGDPELQRARSYPLLRDRGAGDDGEVEVKIPPVPPSRPQTPPPLDRRRIVAEGAGDCLRAGAIQRPPAPSPSRWQSGPRAPGTTPDPDPEGGTPPPKGRSLDSAPVNIVPRTWTPPSR